MKQWGIAAVMGVTTACTSIAGLDHDYELDETMEGQPGGTGGGGMGGGGGMAGAGPSPENCFDGIDNDKDELIDCADKSDCEPLVECVPAIPPGWSAHVRLIVAPYTGMPASPPLCPSGSPPAGYVMGPAGPPTCTACSCMRTGAACSAPTIECFVGTLTCQGAAAATYKADNDACISLAGFSMPVTDESCQIAGPATVVNQGTCSTSGGEMMAGPAWQNEVLACPLGAGNGAGCGVEQACAAKPSADYPGALCIQAAGAQPCPAGWNASGFSVFAGGTDTRACSSCACNNDLSCATDGFYTVFNNVDCTGTNAVVNGACTGAVAQHIGTNSSLKPKLATVITSTCSGGQPTGSVVGQEPITICCQ